MAALAALAEVVIGDEAAAWGAAGFAVDGDHAAVGAVRLTFTGVPDAPAAGTETIGSTRPGDIRGILRWAFTPDEDRAGADALDGLPTAAPTAPDGDLRPGADAHPNGVTGLDHLVVLSPDVDRTTDAFTAAGLDLRRVRPVGDAADRRVQVFFRAGEVIIELVGAPRSPGPVEGGEPAPTGPATFYGLAFTVADLDATAAHLGGLVSPIRTAVQPGRRIATLRHRELDLSVPVAFLSQRVRGDTARSEAGPA
jgi:hypothetical protein